MCGIAVQVQAGVILSPTAVTTDMGNRFSGNIANTINQSFLANPFISGVTDFDTYNPSSQTISNNGSDQWWSSQGVTTGVTDFDLGESYNVSRLAFWNANLNFGMRDFRVLIDDNAAFSSATVMGSFTATFVQNNTGQVFDLADATGRYVRFEHLTTYSNSSNINEVAFDVSGGVNAVPEPSSLAVFGIVACGVGFGVTRRRRGESTTKADA